MTNQSNEKYPDSYVVRSDDYWDNVVDIEYFQELNEIENKWNTNEISDEDKYSCNIGYHGHLALSRRHDGYGQSIPNIKK
ncbi:MAG: hypothetical protein IPO48_11610 [Saprospiraceae bacterium]|nr:hypothetical protein [Saprospiraceae bacterium]